MEHLTAPQRMLLNELDLGKLIKKAGINKQAPMGQYPQRSGNLETPAKNPRHRQFMGQDPEGRGTRADKPGRESSENTVHASPTSMNDPAEDPTGLENLGEPLSRGIAGSPIGDDASLHPSQNYKPTKVNGPAEDPGTQRWNSFGNRYPRAGGV